MNSNHYKRPVVIGEVLFDCFQDRRVLGGAPFNVAWNLRGLGLNPLLVTAVGDDEDGRQILAAMRQWGLDTAAVQVSSQHPTGVVDVTIHDGEPQYDIRTAVAYDFIETPPPAATLDAYGICYHGSLAFRSPTTRATIERWAAELPCPRFLDINIRDPHFDDDWLEPLVTGVGHLKLNRDELQRLCPAAANDRADDLEAVRRHAKFVQERYQVGQLWITLGAQGAMWVGAGDAWCVELGSAVANFTDAVGAGDSFAAVVIKGILSNRQPAAALRRANAMAARVCGLRGATTSDTDFYVLKEPE